MAEDYLAKAQIAVEMAQSQGASTSEAYVSARKETTVLKSAINKSKQ
jgi:hypothetical protein